MVGVILAALTAGVLPVRSAHAWEVGTYNVLPQEYSGVGVTERLGETVELGLRFTDHRGEQVALRELVGDRPLLLTLNYYECPSICTLQLNGLSEALAELDLPGEAFRVATLSIAPREGTEMARDKREAYLELVGREDIRWDFLVGGELPIRMLAEQLGFGYRLDPRSGEYAHHPVAFFISPSGVITRYLYGLSYSPRDLRFALIESGEGQVGSTIDRIVMSCFNFVDGTYAPYAYGIMRLGGFVVVSAMAVFLAVLWRREKRRRRVESTT